MVGRRAASPSAHWAASALLAALGTFATVGSGCSQLLGISDITAITASDGATSDIVSDIVGDDSVADVGVFDVASEGVASESGPSDTDAAACTGDLSNVHTGDFLISFTLQTNQPDEIVALLNQRFVCDQTIFWDVKLVHQQIYVELASSPGEGGYMFINSTSPPLNDNQPHDVVILRAKWVVQIVVDGKPVGARGATQDLGGLPILRKGDDVCVGGDGTVKLRGTISNICVRPS